MTTDNRTNEPARRLQSCVDAWPECSTGDYNPSCCRFPKSCSATVYSAEYVTEDDLEPRAALVAAAGAAPQAESEHEYLLKARALHQTNSGLPSSTVDEAFERAKLTIEGVHQVHGVECLCGFKSNRSRSRTEHITHALKVEWLKEQGR